MNEENKENLEKKVQEEQQEEKNEVVEESNVSTTKFEDGGELTKPNESVPEDSEQYYDDIDYQNKKEQEEIKEKTRSVLREVLDWVLCFVLAFVIYLLINYFFICAPGVKQESMYPTIENGEKVVTIRPWLKGNNFKYGDIITFEAPIDNKLYLDTGDSYTAQYEQYTGITLFLYNFLDVNKVSYIKRVIGLPGDHIVIKDGAVYRNDEKLEEPYIRVANTESEEDKYSDLVVPEGTIYVMGDNREQSKDSRWFGCIPYERVNGFVLGRIWPLNKFGAIDK